MEVPADAAINHAAALEYWNRIEPTVNGMLGGYAQISRVDLQTNANFLAKLRRRHANSTPVGSHPHALKRAVDCGAGIGRITIGFLLHVADFVDVVEPVEKFTADLREKRRLGDPRIKGRIGEIYNVGLEDWVPSHTYDLIWNQWCLGHLTDEQLVSYLSRCRGAVTSHGWIVVKENLSTDVNGNDIFDDLDNSVTRSDEKLRSLFQLAELNIVATELQRGFPKALYPVRMYALQPSSA